MSFMTMLARKLSMPLPEETLPGRAAPIVEPGAHFVNGRPLAGPYPNGYAQVLLGLGCFWGAERAFWELPGVWVTAVGYAGGVTPNPTYQEVCTGQTGHTEAVLVVYDPEVVGHKRVLEHFWESHDPTQGMRQGNDIGTQYRSAVYTSDPAIRAAFEATRTTYQAALAKNGIRRAITTEFDQEKPFYFAETEHQQYLAKNPGGYCGLGGTGVACRTPTVP